MSYIEGLLAENEKIILATRQHLIALFLSAVRNLIIAIAALVLSIAFTAMLAQAGDRFAWLRFAPLLLLLIPVAGFLRDYAAWLSRELVLTNRRVIQSEGIISKHVIDSSLEKVNDIVMRQSLWGRLLDYGDVEILTASETGVNSFRRVPQPIKFKTEILNQKQAYGTDDQMASIGAEVAGAIPVLIGQLDALRKQGILTEEEFQKKKAELLARM
ncbi:MAG: PH domain-containing protein [Chloroflexi bacterium]|nr:PH domain-containing protein [Chloroflexota bacterium]